MAGGDTPMGAEGQRPSKLASFLLILAIVLVANSAFDLARTLGESRTGTQAGQREEHDECRDQGFVSRSHENGASNW